MWWSQLAGLPVNKASPVAGVGKSAAAIAPATSAAVSPGSDVRMDVHRSLEQG